MSSESSSSDLINDANFLNKLYEKIISLGRSGSVSDWTQLQPHAPAIYLKLILIRIVPYGDNKA